MIHRRALFAMMVPVVLASTGCGYNQIQTLDE